MLSNRNRIYVFFVGFIIFSMACSVFGGGDNENTSSSSKDISKYLGDEYRSEVGGFSIRQAKDFEFKDVIGIINMTAADADKDIGPGIMVMGGLMEEEMTNADLLKKMRNESSAIKILKEKSIKVAGINGYSADIEGTYDDKPIVGKVVVAMVTPKQQFNMMGIAPEGKWKELSPIFDAVLGSVKFFEPVPDAVTTTEEGGATGDLPVPLEADSSSSGGKGSEGNSSPGEIRQWAVSARASSQYGDPSWAASQAVGEPNVNDCEDNGNAWASKNSNTVEWIELTYEIPVYPTQITIAQSYNPSQIVEVQMIGTDGKKYIVWDGYPEKIEFCPAYSEITVEHYKNIKVNKLRITVDQRQMGWGWNEIDAVELVGTTDTSVSTKPQQPSSSGSTGAAIDTGKPAPTNFTGWMAGKNYQGYAKIVINKTMQKDLDGMIGLKGKKSTEGGKPRPDHKDTYIYEFPDGMRGFIAVLNSGVVYRKSISSGAHPKDFKLDTVTKANYQKLDAIYKKDQRIPYSVMANLLKSPGFIREAYFADDKMKIQYEWFSPNGDRISGFFLDDVLTGMAGLVFIPNE